VAKMKIRIKKTKQIDEISAVTSVGAMGYAGKKEELTEDGEGQGAATFGSTPPKDADELKGLKQRARRQGNRAVCPQGQLLGEEDLDESMTPPVGHGIRGFSFAQMDDEPDPYAWEKSLERSFEVKGDRARYPEGDILARNAKYDLNESTSFDDMDSIDREFFANASDSIEVDQLANLNDADAAKKSLQDKGYVVEEELGRGMWGVVYKGRNPFKQPCAIKIVTGDGAARELSNYQTIGAARATNELIAKHFPNVMEAWSPRDGVAVVAMEMLQPLSDAQATFIPDASYLAGKNKAHKLALAADSYSGMRDMSQRFTHYIQNNIQEVSAMFDARAYNLVLDYRNEWRGKITPEKMEDAKAEVSPESLLQIMQIGSSAPRMSQQYFENRKSSMTRILGAGSDAVHFMEILQQEAPNALGANAALAEIAFRIMLVGLMAGATENEIDTEIRFFAKRFLELARQFTQMPLGYEVPSINMPQRGHERLFLTSKGLHSAIKALYDQTGLIAKDLHDNNVMARPNGDVVIVDVGLFRPDSGWVKKNNLQEMLRIRKKMLRNLQK